MTRASRPTTSKTLAETNTCAVDFIHSLVSAPLKNTAVIVGLYGDLGSGKTTFTQAAARALGVTETVNSPTFIIQKKYPLPRQAGEKKSPASQKSHKALFKNFIHIDAYRLDKSEELLHLGWNELIADPGNLIFVEWPARVASIMPADTIKINFKFVDETSREIVIEH